MTCPLSSAWLAESHKFFLSLTVQCQSILSHHYKSHYYLCYVSVHWFSFRSSSHKTCLFKHWTVLHWVLFKFFLLSTGFNHIRIQLDIKQFYFLIKGKKIVPPPPAHGTIQRFDYVICNVFFYFDFMVICMNAQLMVIDYEEKK